MLSSIAPSALFHGDGAPGDGAEDCITNIHRFWWVELGSSPRRRPTRRRVFPAQLFSADGVGLLVGWISCGLLGPFYFFIPLVLGPLNSLVWYVPSLRYTHGLGWRMHCGVEVTESSTNKKHLSNVCHC
jgi:hypothetical protein